MRVTKRLQDAYRGQLEELESKAASYVESYMGALRVAAPDASVAEIREAAKDAISNALNIFGDQAGTLACDLFDEIMAREGRKVDSRLHTNVIDSGMMDDKVRFFARDLLNEDGPGFVNKITDLTRFYVKRSAYENMIRNCDRNKVRYARVPSGRETCAFCFMLSSRGFVYHSELTAKGRGMHGTHSHCDCIIVPGVAGTTKIDGYNPDAMRKRWRQCAETVGVDPNKADGFASRKKVMDEVARRDWHWLYIGKSPKGRYDPEWDDYEKDTAVLLESNGFAVDYIERSNAERRPDFYLNGVKWEMKNPENKGYMPIWNQFKTAVFGHGKSKVRNPQSDRLVISGKRSGMNLDEMENHVLEVSHDFKDTFPEIVEVLLVTEDGVRRIKR